MAATLTSLMQFADKNECSSLSSSSLLDLEVSSGLEDQLTLRLALLFYFFFLVYSGDGALGGLATYTF